MKQIIVAISAFFAFLGAEAPDWFSNPRLNGGFVYGFGIGSDIRVAKESAMTDLAKSLQSRVRVFFQRETSRNDMSITSSASQRLSIDSGSVDFVNIEPKKVECSQDQCYVLIEINKEKLLSQLKQRIENNTKALNDLNSPFDYSYKKNVLYPKILEDYFLYSALGGLNLQIPEEIGEKPSFDLRFEYEGNFSKSFKGILEKTIQDNLTQFGILSPSSEWKIVIAIFQEDKSVSLDIELKYQEKVIHNASVYDVKKLNVSSAFFAKRLGVQVYKKMRKWGEKN